jgi:hypothetical protein
MIEFLIGLLIAFLSGTLSVSAASSMTSDSPTQRVSYELQWPCGDETCWLVYDDGKVETGP